MNQSLVITAIGNDRPGIVNELTEVLHKASLNLEDSRMSILGGEFAIILLVSGDETSTSSIIQQKEALQNSPNLNLLIKTTTNPEHGDDLTSFKIKIEGMDSPGIVHKLALYLSQHSINIVNMQTNSSHAPHTGSPVFMLEMLVDIPAGKDINQLTDEFTALCDELSMDVDFSPA